MTHEFKVTIIEEATYELVFHAQDIHHARRLINRDDWLADMVAGAHNTDERPKEFIQLSDFTVNERDVTDFQWLTEGLSWHMRRKRKLAALQSASLDTPAE